MGLSASTPRRPRYAGLLFALLLLTVAIAAILGYVLFARPVLVFTNRLIAPVRVILNGNVHTVTPGATVRFPLPRSQTTVAEWEMVRPLSADGGVMGVPLRGSVVADGKRRVQAAAENWGLDADYFAPLITNRSSTPVRIVVNAGMPDAQDCRCAVRPGAQRVFIGYYPLYRNSTVQARAAGPRTATFRDLGPQVRAPDGTLGLGFREQDLRP